MFGDTMTWYIYVDDVNADKIKIRSPPNNEMQGT
jgi:hypothetical protein